ncbi:hypothetical protein ACFU53_02630 [Streptomyces sp. NPDC057474]|uniref:hypothetical protein n=1 Tax=Streptomyces sp. NPDC057474 TaxID=3346144 RepID=UPI0036768552
MPEHTAAHRGTSAPELPVTLDMPGKVADSLRAVVLEPAERAALDQGVTVRRGQGYTLRVRTVPSFPCQLLAHCQLLDGSRGHVGDPGTAQGPPRVREPRQYPRGSHRALSGPTKIKY